MKNFYIIFWLLMATATSMVGYNINHSLFWACVNFVFWPISIVKWLICHQLTLSVIKQTFAFFFS